METKAIYQLVGAGIGAIAGLMFCNFTWGFMTGATVGVMSLVGFFIGGAVGSSSTNKQGTR